MSISKHFAADYQEARRKFLDASRKAGGELESIEHPTRGPGGESLHTDISWHGSKAAEKVLITISATHGVEGFCGSGPQIAWLEEGLHDELPNDIALLQIHAINPHGFAWLRRVTQENVDLNRNFADHQAPLPTNSGYEELHGILCPEEWNDSVIAETRRQLDAYAEAHGPRGLQQAISGGQYSHADGIFYGGKSATWSHKVLRQIFSTRLGKAKQAAVIDYHTGLGPRGYGERICVHAPDSHSLELAREWYEGDITSPMLGTSSSCVLSGTNTIGMESAAPDCELVIIALEYGTLPSPEVRLALRADNWLHHHGDLSSPKGRAIKSQIREAFYGDDEAWKESIWERAVETQRLAVRGLAGN